MTYAAVSGAHEKTQGTSASSAINTTGADLIVANVIGSEVALAFAPTFVDSKGNTYSSSSPWPSVPDACNVHTQIFYAQSPTVGSGHTFTVGGTLALPAHQVQAFSGSAVSPFDQENGTGNSLNVTSFQPGSITPSQANCLVVSGTITGGDTLSIGSSFTITDSDVCIGGTQWGSGFAYLIQGAAAAVNPTWSWSSNLANNQAASIVSFKPSTATDAARHFPRGVHRGLLRGAA